MTNYSSFDRRISSLRLWRIYFYLIILQGLITLALIFQTRSETGIFLGLSGIRGVIVAVILCIMAAAGWALVESWRKAPDCVDKTDRLLTWLEKPGRWAKLSLLFGFILVAGSYQLTLIPELEEPFTAKLLSRLAPVIFWVTGFCAQTLAVLLYLRIRKDALKLRPIGKIFWIILAYFAGVFLVWIWATPLVIPAASEKVGWNVLGAPILEFQVLLAWATGVVLLLLVNRLNTASFKPAWLKKLTPHKSDLAIACLIWLCAVVFWQSTPITPNWFLSEKLPPNEAYYPFSDARHYDRVAQSALIGEGFKFFNGWDVRRPLHGAYLTILHLIAGQEYESVITLQVLLLALLPVLIYFLAKSLHNRFSGVVAAVLVILRETNSISITANITTSNVKLLMVDLPVTLCVVFFALMAIKWLQQLDQQTGQPALLALVSGGILGLAILIRLETLVLSLSPVLVASLILIPRKKYTLWCKQLIFFSLGVVLVISPWVYRNWHRTGLFFIDSPVFRFGIIYQRFMPPTVQAVSPTTPTSNEQILVVPSTTALSNTPPPATPLPVTPTPVLASGQSWVEIAAQSNWQETLKQPGDLISYALAHYANNQIQSILIFPTTYRGFDSTLAFLAHRDLFTYLMECFSLSYYSRRVPYWKKWDGTFPGQSILPILFSILIIAAGVQLAWNKQKLVSLLPVCSLLIYIGFNALLRNSGGRYLLPVDWGGILFYSIGIVGITVFVINNLTGKQLKLDLPFKAETAPSKTAKQGSLLSQPRFYLAATGFFLIGCMIPLIEVSFPERYTEATRQKMLTAVWNSPLISADVHGDLKGFLSNGGIATAGRALYPQFFPANYGRQDSETDPLAPKPYPRIAFNLTANYSLDLALPFDKKSIHFPNASDVLVFLCPSGTTFSSDPLAVAVFDANDRLTDLYLRTPYPTKPACPLPAVKESN